MLKKRTLILLSTLIFLGQRFAMAMASRPADPNAPPQPAWMQFFPFLVMIGVFYFLLIRPQMKQRKDRQAMTNNLKRGDRIVTQGGLIATVVNVSGGIVEAKINEETKVKFLSSAVTEILTDQPTTIVPTVVS